jgi:hypothetical protein
LLQERLGVRSESEKERKENKNKQVGTSGTNKSQEDKIEEMSRIIKDLSNKLARMETKRRRPDNRNPNQFRRPFNPPKFYKEKGEMRINQYKHL